MSLFPFFTKGYTPLSRQAGSPQRTAGISLLENLKERASKCPHVPGDTQAVFWVVTCLPSKINSQEAEASCYFMKEGEISSSWHVEINDGAGGGEAN